MTTGNSQTQSEPILPHQNKSPNNNKKYYLLIFLTYFLTNCRRILFKQTDDDDGKEVERFTAADLKLVFGKNPGKNAKRNIDKCVMSATAASWEQISMEEWDRTILSPYFTEVNLL